MDKAMLEALGEFLSEAMPNVPEDCDETLKHTEAWLRSHSKDMEADLDWIKQNGGCCDCEVGLNVVARADYLLPETD